MQGCERLLETLGRVNTYDEVDKISRKNIGCFKIQ